MNERIPTFVFGGRGLLAGEFARLALGHPQLDLVALVSREAFDPRVDQPHLVPAPRGVDQESGHALVAEALERHDRVVVVAGLPHGHSAGLYDELAERLGDAFERVVVLDLAADFRLADAALHEATYGDAAHPARDSFAYGLPELFREGLAGARHVAAPGCFATALQLAAVPAARAELLSTDAPWIFFGVTGSSGSGASPKAGTHHPYRAGNLWAYAVDGHRHEAELAQAVAPSAPAVHFVPHSGPFVRGIHLTATLPLADGATVGDLRAAYDRAFADEPFVTRVDDRPPALRTVVGSNRAEVGVSTRGGLGTVLVTIDNLVKGGAGQGLQALNLVLGLPETLGVPLAGQGVS